MAKVLVADDSIAVRKVAERLLTEAGLDVSLAASGDEAMALLSSERPDLIVCDVIMPDKSGYEVCAFVRAQPNLATVPVLLVSGIVNAEVNRQAESCQADSVLKKPFQGTSLKDRVLELLAKGPEGPAAPAPTTSAETESVSEPEKGKVYRITEEQLQAFRQATSKIQELESALTTEQQRSSQLTHQLQEMDQLRERVEELDMALRNERDAAAQLVKQLEETEQHSSNAKELNALLAKEQEEKTRMSQEVVELQQVAAQVKELEGDLEKERERCSRLDQQLADTAIVAGKVEELETALAKEREQTAHLTLRIKDLEPTAARVDELEALLAQECEQTAAMSQRIAAAELFAAKAQARQEEITRKLGEIADLSK